MPKEMTVVIPMEEGEPLGAVPNEKLVIIKVQEGTLAEGKLKVGDQILKVNDEIVRDTDHFYQLLRFAPPIASILLVRDAKKAAELEAKVHIPPERAKFILRRDGYTYFLSRIDWKPGGPKLGLGIKHYQNRVLVSRTDQNSLAAQFLLVGDHIIDIDGRPVSDKDVCRELLLKSFQTQRFATMVIERPETMEARHWVQSALASSSAQAPSVAMNSDVREIAARERQKLKKNLMPKKSCMRKSNAIGKAITINENRATEFIIASDNEGKVLRHVRR
ncbi:PDZ/DHR/GLGF domain protein [Onchocerca flexuosa]|uniref:PDZ/DHR/GLGF domain protein n=1 Tax=Onchocerca flexuosa TaxID=387005 RepID=A0A238BQE2_9BILA|nr:PDZ/DHR/GLGF domain protein [Onchocerca flexuosa]